LSSSPKISNVFDSLDVDLCLYTSRELAFFYSVVGMTVEMLKLKSAESAKEEELAQVHWQYNGFYPKKIRTAEVNAT